MKPAEDGTLLTEGLFDGRGYLRLLDVSDPANIVELDQFATENVFVNPPLPGDRTMDNVLVDVLAGSEVVNETMARADA